MHKYLVKEYYGNQKPPFERETIVKADSAIEAIQSVRTWKYTCRWTSMYGNDPDPAKRDNAATSDGDGRNGCRATRFIPDPAAFDKLISYL